MENMETDVLKYQEFVKEIARSVHEHLSRDVDVRDLIEFGQIGLIEALNRYDANRGIKFKTYAYYRIKGSMFDGLKGVKYNPRARYYKAKCAQACADLMQAHEYVQETPTVQEEIEQLKQFCKEMTQVYILSLDEAGTLSLDDSPEQNLISSQLGEILRESLRKLPDREARIVYLYYYRGNTITEAAKILGIHRSWASKLHARALKHLHVQLSQLL